MWWSLLWLGLPLCLLALLANALALAVFERRHVFRRILANRLVINLMSVNLVSCLLLFPATLLDCVWDKPNWLLCDLVSSAHVFVAHASVLAMVAIGLDHYWGVLYSLEYSTQVTPKKCVRLMALVWILSTTATVLNRALNPDLNLVWHACNNKNESLFNENSESQMDLMSNQGLVSSLLLLLAFFVLPMLALLFIYLRIFFAARRSSRVLRRRRSVKVSNASSIKTNEDNKNSNQDDISENQQDFNNNNNNDDEDPGIHDNEHLQNQLVENQDSVCGASSTQSSPVLCGKRISIVVVSNEILHKSECAETGLLRNHLQKQLKSALFPPKQASNCSTRKCSFSSVTECRMEQDGKQETFQFHLQAPSTHASRNQLHEDLAESSIEDSPMKTLNLPSGTTSVMSEGESLRPSNSFPRDRLSKSGSLISMTSQAARRLSCTVSRRASSVYDFFQYAEEVRTAKLSTLVIVLAALCWTPHFALFAITANMDNMADIVDDDKMSQLHLICVLSGSLFALFSPILYVFRSEQVCSCIRKWLNQLRERANTICRDRIKWCGGSNRSDRGCSRGMGARSISCPLLIAEINNNNNNVKQCKFKGGLRTNRFVSLRRNEFDNKDVKQVFTVKRSQNRGEQEPTIRPVAENML